MLYVGGSIVEYGSAWDNPLPDTGWGQMGRVYWPDQPFNLSPINPLTAGNNAVGPGPGALLLNGLAPTIVQNAIVTPGAGVLSLVGPAPTITQNRIVLPGAGVITLSGPIPTIVQSKSVVPGAGVITLSGPAPSIVQVSGTLVQPGAGAVTLNGPAPSISQNTFFGPAPGTIFLTGPAPTILQSGPQSVIPNPGFITLSGPPPSIVRTVTLTNSLWTVVAHKRNFTINKDGVMLPAKTPREVITVIFDYSAVSTSVSAPIVSVESVAGSRPDLNPSAVLQGPPQVSGAKVLQQMSGGLSGTYYEFNCIAQLVDGTTYELTGTVPVRDL